MAQRASRWLVVAVMLAGLAGMLGTQAVTASTSRFYALSVLPMPSGTDGWILGGGSIDDAGDVFSGGADTGGFQRVIVWPHGSAPVQPADYGIPQYLTHGGVFLYWNNQDGQIHQYVVASGTDSLLDSVLPHVNAMNAAATRMTVGTYTPANSLGPLSAGEAPVGSNNINQITDLGFGIDSGATDINDAGDVVGFGSCSTYQQCAYVRYHDASAMVIGPTGDDTSATMQATRINASGEVIGNSWSNGGFNRPPFIYTRSGGLKMLGTSTAPSGAASAINSAGDVVGEIADSTAVIWPSGSTDPIDLNGHIAPTSLTGWHLDEATGINDQGLIAALGTLNGQDRMFILTPVQDGVAPTSTGTVEDGSGAAVSPNASGWYTASGLKLHVQVSDDANGFGLGSLTVSVNGTSTTRSLNRTGQALDALTFSEGMNDVSYYATDLAGNVESAHELTVKYDKSAPTWSCDPAPADWHKGNVTLNCSAGDNASGVATPGTTFSLSTNVGDGVEDANASTNGVQVCDAAGNCATAQVTGIKIDNRAPDVSCDDPGSGWHASDVTVSCSASDGGSGLADTSDSQFSLSTNVGSGVETTSATTNSHDVCDVAGNCSMAGPISNIKIDTKGPEITISAPANAQYTLGQHVTAQYSCADGGSGVGSCAGPVASGSAIDTATVGSKTFTVQASDLVGNAGSKSVTYTVAYNVCLQYNPTSAAKSGNTIPIKIQLCDLTGKNLSSPALTVHAMVVRSAGGAEFAPQDSGSANTGQNFRYSSGMYLYNLKTTGVASGQYQLIFQVGSDTIQYSAPFTVR